MPLISRPFLRQHWKGRVRWPLVTLAVVAPFIYAIARPHIRISEREKLIALSGKVSYVPIVVMSLFSVFWL